MNTSDQLSLRHYGASPGSHSHGHFQILLGLSGTLELEVEGCGVRVASGSGCVIAPGHRHDFESLHGSLCLVLDSVHPDWAQCAGRRDTVAPPAQTLALAHYLASALQSGRPLAQAHGPALLREAWLAGSLAPTLPPLPRAAAALTGPCCSNGRHSNGTTTSPWRTWPCKCT